MIYPAEVKVKIGDLKELVHSKSKVRRVRLEQN